MLHCPLELALVGVGDGPLRHRIEQLPNCTCVGPVANDDVRDYLSASDVLLLPSYSEGLPTVVVEAGMVGNPVIGTTVGGIPELLDKGRGLLIKTQKPRGPGQQSSLCMRTRRADADADCDALHVHTRKHYDSKVNTRMLVATYARAQDQQCGRMDSGEALNPHNVGALTIQC